MKTKKTPNRSFHVLDVENELSGGNFAESDVARLRRVWNIVVEPADQDLYFLATGTRTAAAIAFGWPSATKEVREGKDGADEAIIEHLDVDYVSARFDHVFLGTGDHRMQPKAKALIEAGVKVTIVGHKHNIHWSYYTVRGIEFKYLDEQWALAA
jgi:hypothetical protein